MVTGKEKFALWLTPEAREMVRGLSGRQLRQPERVH